MNSCRVLGSLLGLAALSVLCPSPASASLPALKVSADGRSLIEADGQPFFYLGDTAWELFHKASREDADTYLKDRAAKGYTVIQAVALGELDGLRTPNAYGHQPFVSLDTLEPLVKEGPQNDYWDQVDYIVDRAESLGLRIGLLPTWGDKWNLKWGTGPVVFNPEKARRYGEWLGKRYTDKAVIWILGGDRPIETPEHRQIIEAMVEGLKKGDGGRHLMTFHPWGGTGSSEWWHEAPWLDFNMRQNGHNPEYKNFDGTRLDYERKPVKPVLDGEPLYEDHPLSFKADEFGHSVAAEVRRPLYWNLFNGAFGHTYGHHSIWQFYRGAGDSPVNAPLMTWREAILQPGAAQMQYGRKLMESRPFLERLPDPTLIVDAVAKTAMPGAGRARFVAIRGADASWAMVYAPVGRAFTVRTGKLSGEKLRVWWFDPRTGAARDMGLIAKNAETRFISPDAGEMLDWVLVLDDAARKFPAPGTSL